MVFLLLLSLSLLSLIIDLMILVKGIEKLFVMLHKNYCELYQIYTICKCFSLKSILSITHRFQILLPSINLFFGFDLFILLFFNLLSYNCICEIILAVYNIANKNVINFGFLHKELIICVNQTSRLRKATVNIIEARNVDLFCTCITLNFFSSCSLCFLFLFTISFIFFF
jgi:hypothetical protein